MKFCIGIDLGSDTLKIAYAYSSAYSEITGKIAESELSMTAIPAVAMCVDAEKDVWVYGERVEKTCEKSFANVVKIKRLLQLLANTGTDEQKAENEDYYKNRHVFPQFFFPRRNVAGYSLAKLQENEMTFSVPRSTPRSVCENYFRFVYQVVDTRLKDLCRALGVPKSYDLGITLIYPPYVGTKFVDELKRLVYEAFRVSPGKTISVTKALSAYARYSRKINKGESILLFNMGEEEISVVKANYSDNGVSVDGVDGHSGPLTLGGNDIDDAIANYIEHCIVNRETMGTPSVDDEDGGHVYESGLNSKQYLFVKEIKMTKIFIGKYGDDGKHFIKGYPINIARDLYIQSRITAKQFFGCLSSPKNSIAARIADYIVNEKNKPINRDVGKIFLSGGLVETYGLVDYITEKVESRTQARVLTFEKEHGYYKEVKNDGFNILECEDAVYAAAVGGAIALLKNYEIATTVALTYGIRLFLISNKHSIFCPLLNKGTIIKEGVENFVSPTCQRAHFEGVSSAAMPIWTLPWTVDELKQKRMATFEEEYLFMGEDSEDEYKVTQKLNERLGLKIHGYNKIIPASMINDYIYFYYDGQRVEMTGISEQISNGSITVRVNRDGEATPVLQNLMKPYQRNVTVWYLDSNGARTGSPFAVDASKIEYRFPANFTVSGMD